jgi:hypothetical protein
VDMLLEKYSGFNFHKWKVKIQMHLMNKNLWGIVKGTEATSVDPNKLIEGKLVHAHTIQTGSKTRVRNQGCHHVCNVRGLGVCLQSVRRNVRTKYGILDCDDCSIASKRKQNH